VKSLRATATFRYPPGHDEPRPRLHAHVVSLLSPGWGSAGRRVRAGRIGMIRRG